MTHRSSQRRAHPPRRRSSCLADLSTGTSVTSHFPVQTLSQASSNYQNPRYLEQGLPLVSWTDVDPCNWVPRPLGPALLCKLGFPDSSIGKESACNAGDSDSWVRKIHWRRDRLHTPVFLGFPCGSAGKESACNVEDLGLIPGLERSPGRGKGYPLQYSGLENFMDYVVHGVTKSQTGLSNFHFHCVSFAKRKDKLTVFLIKNEGLGSRQGGWAWTRGAGEGWGWGARRGGLHISAATARVPLLGSLFWLRSWSRRPIWLSRPSATMTWPPAWRPWWSRVRSCLTRSTTCCQWPTRTWSGAAGPPGGSSPASSKKPTPGQEVAADQGLPGKSRVRAEVHLHHGPGIVG